MEFNKTNLFDQLFQRSGANINRSLFLIKLDNEVLLEFYSQIKFSHEEFLNHPLLSEIMNNYIIVKETNDFLTSKSNVEFFYEKQNNEIISIENLPVLDSYRDKGKLIYLIDGVLLSEAQLQSLTQKEIPQETINYLSTLPYDLFVHLVKQEEIKGKDLLSLCLSNKEINKKCNKNKQYIFSYLLEKDYGIMNDKTPRETYFREANTITYLTYMPENPGEIWVFKSLHHENYYVTDEVKFETTVYPIKNQIIIYNKKKNFERNIGKYDGIFSCSLYGFRKNYAVDKEGFPITSKTDNVAILIRNGNKNVVVNPIGINIFNTVEPVIFYNFPSENEYKEGAEIAVTENYIYFVGSGTYIKRPPGKDVYWIKEHSIEIANNINNYGDSYSTKVIFESN